MAEHGLASRHGGDLGGGELAIQHDDTIRGHIVAMNEKTMRVATDEGAIQVALEPDARFQVDGLPADRKAVANKGGEVVIYPKRGRTIIAFTPMQPE